MHCSLCRQSGYNKTKYPTKPQQDEEYKKRRVETREHPMKHARKREKKRSNLKELRSQIVQKNYEDRRYKFEERVRRLTTL